MPGSAKKTQAPCAAGGRATRHSAPRLFPALRNPPLCRCAECHAVLRQQAPRAFAGTLAHRFRQTSRSFL